MRTCYCVPAVMALATLGACDSDRRTTPATDASQAAFTAASSPDPWTLLKDDFDAESLDPLRWRVMLPPGSTPGVFVRDGQLVMQNRGHLNTAEQFDPAAVGGLRLSGEWTTAAAPDDFLQILTRSDGIPVPPFGETRSGVEFLALTLRSAEAPNYMTIVGRGAARGTVTDVYSPGSLLIVPGVTYRFYVVDDGVNVRFTLTNKADSTQTRTVTAKSGYHAAANLVTFHNREKCCAGSHTSRLDDVVLERLVLSVTIDINPGRSPNAVNPRSKDLIPVAILSTPEFDAATIDPRSARFGPGGATVAHQRGHREDVNADGLADVVLHFATAASGIRCGATRAVLRATNPAGKAVRGTDAIETVGCE